METPKNESRAPFNLYSYRKVAGDTCSGGEEALYSPVTVPCPQSGMSYSTAVQRII